jgi:carboxypeptidase C (cathepsin A)
VKRLALLLLTSALFAQQSNPPAERVQRTPQAPTQTQTAPAESPAPAQRTGARPGGEPQSQPSQQQQAQPSQQQPARQQQEAPRPAAPEQTLSTPAGGIPAGMHFDMTETPAVQTHHTMNVGGQALRYTATAGRLPIKDAEGRTEALMFFVAYTLDGADPGTRPLTFSYNGGPGAASIWLHMGALGPKKIVMQPEGWLPQAPYRFADNPYTPLDKTDVVMMDAIGTGYSRPADAAAARKYWNPTGDIQAAAEFVRIYLSRYERWSSPLYILGESYGTTRAAGVSGYLSSRGINFNGIVLLSTVLNFQSLVFARTNDEPYPLILPSYTSIAWYHKKLPQDLMGDAAKARAEAERWAMTDYWPALNKGDALTPQERQQIIDGLARFTGLPKEIIHQNNLRIDVGTFTHYLLADKLLRAGRLDGRFADPDPQGFSGGGPGGFNDPASSQTEPPFTMAFYDYVRRELNYKVDMPYYVSAQWSGMFQWSASATGPFGGQGFQDTASALREALVKNRFLKVLVMEGYYDLATPYFAANYTMDHLNLPAEYRKNISYATYDSGHMVYLEQKSHDKMKRDFVKFIGDTLGRPSGTRSGGE